MAINHAMISDFAPNTTVFTDPRVTGIQTQNELRTYMAREWRFKALSMRGVLRFLRNMGKA